MFSGMIKKTFNSLRPRAKTAQSMYIRCFDVCVTLLKACIFINNFLRAFRRRFKWHLCRRHKVTVVMFWRSCNWENAWVNLSYRSYWWPVKLTKSLDCKKFHIENSHDKQNTALVTVSQWVKEKHTNMERGDVLNSY